MLNNLKFYSQFQQLKTLKKPLYPHRKPRPILLKKNPQYQLNKQTLINLIQKQIQ